MSSAPARFIVSRSSSPHLSTSVTSVRSITHLGPSCARRLFQFVSSSVTHGPVSRPCKIQRCSWSFLVIVIRNTPSFLHTLEEMHGPCQMHSRGLLMQTLDLQAGGRKSFRTLKRFTAAALANCQSNGSGLLESANHAAGP